jgi:hypothetical protein
LTVLLLRCVQSFSAAFTATATLLIPMLKNPIFTKVSKPLSMGTIETAIAPLGLLLFIMSDLLAFGINPPVSLATVEANAAGEYRREEHDRSKRKALRPTEPGLGALWLPKPFLTSNCLRLRILLLLRTHSCDSVF